MMDFSKNCKIFNNIYHYHKWGLGSGTGSIGFLNKPFINFVNDFLHQHPEIKTVIDIGCGDFQIGRHLELKGRNYLGCDVSNIIIEKVKKRFSASGIEFKYLDAVTYELPEGDLAIVKDVLQHLSNEDISIVLSKLSKYSYVMIQNDIYEKDRVNKNIHNGEYRPIDITQAPFNNTNYKLSYVYIEGLYKISVIFKKMMKLNFVKKGIFVKT